MIELSGCTFVAELFGSVGVPCGRRMLIQVVDVVKLLRQGHQTHWEFIVPRGDLQIYPALIVHFPVQRLGRLGLGDLEMGTQRTSRESVPSAASLGT